MVEPFLCDYADAYILVTGNITATGGNANTKAAFKNYHPFIKSEIHLNDEHVETADNLDWIMNIYSLIEYSDNYSDCTAFLCQYERQEPLPDNANLNVTGLSSFKYKSDLLGYATPEDGNAVWKNAQIIVPPKYISSFLRSLELPLINTKLYIKLSYTKNSLISNVAEVSIFKITKTELYVPVVTLTTEDNNKLNQLLDSEFKRIVHWNEYKSKIGSITQAHNDDNFKRTLLDTSIPLKVDLKLSDTQFKKIADSVRNNNGTTIRLSNKNFNKNQLLYELYLTQTQITKLIDKIKNNM